MSGVAMAVASEPPHASAGALPTAAANQYPTKVAAMTDHQARVLVASNASSTTALGTKKVVSTAVEKNAAVMLMAAATVSPIATASRVARTARRRSTGRDPSMSVRKTGRRQGRLSMWVSPGRCGAWEVGLTEGLTIIA